MGWTLRLLEEVGSSLSPRPDRRSVSDVEETVSLCIRPLNSCEVDGESPVVDSSRFLLVDSPAARFAELEDETSLVLL